MAALGLVLIVLSGLLTAGIALSNTDPAHASAFGVTLSNVNIGGLFLVGAITGLVFGIGLALMLAGAARKRAHRRGLKREVKNVRGERESLAEENARLQEQLQRERTTGVHPVGEESYAATDPSSEPVSDPEGRHGLFRR